MRDVTIINMEEKFPISQYQEPFAGDLVVINTLLRELNAATPEITFTQLKKLCAAPNMRLFVARDAGKIIGMATLEVAETLMGTYGYAHDVVVSHEYRGKGLGRMLMEKLMATAAGLGVKHIDLTSNPKRAIGAFYLSLGFIRRDTDCYRKKLA